MCESVVDAQRVCDEKDVEKERTAVALAVDLAADSQIAD